MATMSCTMERAAVICSFSYLAHFGVPVFGSLVVATLCKMAVATIVEERPRARLCQRGNDTNIMLRICRSSAPLQNGSVLIMVFRSIVRVLWHTIPNVPSPFISSA